MFHIKRIMMEPKEILKNVFHIQFPNQQELASAFLRFAEYYQNPFFKGKIFTLDEFREWYIKNSVNGKKTGKFTYYSDWDGFNIPSSVLETFYEGKFNPLSDREKKLLEVFKNKRKNNFYIIGTFRNISKATKKHEIAHGLFNTNSEYKREVLNIIRGIGTTDKRILYGFLRNYCGGYHQDFLEEEGTCYLLDRRCLGRNGIGSIGLKIASDKIKKVFSSKVF